MVVLDRFLAKHRNHHKHASYLKIMRGAVGMMLDPEHTESVFDIEDGLRTNPATSELLRFSAKDDGVKAMIAERYLLPEVPDTEKLKRLPAGTLGRAYAEHLDSMGFDPDYYRKIDVKDDVDYVMMRIRQTHDIWHVVTGFDTHPLGEISVKAVELAQTHRPMAAAICAGGIFRYMMHEPDKFGDCIETIVAGYHLGLRAKPLLAMRWEEHWTAKVEDVRKGLGVMPLGPHGGELTVDLSPHSRAVADRWAHEEMAEALKKVRSIDPEGFEAEPDLDHDHSEHGTPGGGG
ncbi:MAG: Coq4 family protein [Planctomycetota bacterium]